MVRGFTAAQATQFDRWLEPREMGGAEPEACCEVCGKDLYEGERALRDSRFRAARAYICLECFSKADKKELAEWLGGSFEEVF